MPPTARQYYLDISKKFRPFDPGAGEIDPRRFGPNGTDILVRVARGVWVMGFMTEHRSPLLIRCENDPILGLHYGLRVARDLSTRPWERFKYDWEQITLTVLFRTFRSLGLPLPPSLEEDIRDQDQHGIVPAAKPEDPGEDAKPPTTRKPMKEPSANAFAAYRAVKLLGMKQEEVKGRFGVEQSTVSRWVRDVGNWIAAGHVLPDELAAPPPRPKMIPTDPSKLGRGPRRRGRA